MVLVAYESIYVFEIGATYAGYSSSRHLHLFSSRVVLDRCRLLVQWLHSYFCR